MAYQRQRTRPTLALVVAAAGAGYLVGRRARNAPTSDTAMANHEFSRPVVPSMTPDPDGEDIFVPGASPSGLPTNS